MALCVVPCECVPARSLARPLVIGGEGAATSCPVIHRVMAVMCPVMESRSLGTGGGGKSSALWMISQLGDLFFYDEV